MAYCYLKYLCLVFIILFVVSSKKTLFEREGLYIGQNGSMVSIHVDISTITILKGG